MFSHQIYTGPMKRFKKSMTAAEAMAVLQSDPEWVRKNEERERKRKSLEEMLALEEKPILAELADAGVRVSSVWDLVNAKFSYTAAIPVLSRHLRSPYHPKIREGIARALTVSEARGVASRTILDELERQDESPREIRWVLANALTEAADLDMVDEIKTLVADARYEDVREILKLALKTLAAR